MKHFLLISTFAFTSVLTVLSSASAEEKMNSDTVVNGPIYIVSNPSINSVSYPNVEFVNGPIYIVNNPNLVSVSFPKLLYVNGPIYFTYNGNLAETSLPALRFSNGPVYRYGNK